MKNKRTAPDNCTNTKCPYWDDAFEEHCNGSEISESWIKEFCDKQEES